MSKFLHIEHIDDILPFVRDYENIEVIKRDDIIVLGYRLNNTSLFTGDKGIYTQECRGITFCRNTGKILSRPFHKFFNLGETEITLEKNLIDKRIAFVEDKRDGSMIHPLLLNDKLFWKSKRSITSDVANKVNALFGPETKEYKFGFDLLKQGLTPIFEFTAPDNRIVLRYESPELTLLAIRNTITGDYLSTNEQNQLLSDYDLVGKNVLRWETSDITLEHLKQCAETDTNKEGWVITFDDQMKIKLKTNWYRSLHHNVSFTTEQDIAEMVIDETVDDFISYCRDTDNLHLIDVVNKISSVVTVEYSEMILFVENTVEDELSKNTSIKDFAIKYKEHKLFHMLIQRYRGQEPNYKDFYKSYFISKFEKNQL